MLQTLRDDEQALKGGKEHFNTKIRKNHRTSQREDLQDPELIIAANEYYSTKYYEAYRRSLEEPEEFWAEVGKEVTWSKPWTKVLDNSNEPHTNWFVGGELNACYNAVDRHVEAGNGNKVALIHDSPVTRTIRHVTYGELQDKVSRLAGALADLGVTRGDRVLIYMPMVPETIIAMLATVRLGAIHSVVFGGFAARELCVRIEHAEPKVIIAASCGVEPNKIIRYKDILNEAIAISKVKPQRCIIFQRYRVEAAELDPEYDLLWDDALADATPHPCVPVEANDPLYILYTSGTTDQPKGVLRPTGGHIATLAWTMHTIYGMDKNDVWWTASDMGWVVGHSYICYGPLVYGMTSVMYEGKPDRTPDAGQYFRVIQEHQVNALFTAPTALRVIRRVDPEVKVGRKYSTKSLRTLFVAGEHCDHETKAWAGKVFEVPILNHWWQTETGHSITATCLGLEHSLNPPKYSAGMPFPGYHVIDIHCIKILAEHRAKVIIPGYDMHSFTYSQVVLVYSIQELEKIQRKAARFGLGDLHQMSSVTKMLQTLSWEDLGVRRQVAQLSVMVLRQDGSKADNLELGRIVCKLPLPPGTMSTLYKAPERFKQIYFSKFPGYYDTMDAGYVDNNGYVFVTARDDDVINVAGHRLSTSALEDVVLSHPDVGDAAVVGVPEPTKGEIPLCLYIIKQGARKNESEISRELVVMVRELIGPIAAFRSAAAVRGLPRTRSGKTARKSISDLARNKFVKIPGTIEDPTVYRDIKLVLQSLGYAKTAPDPQ